MTSTDAQVGAAPMTSVTVPGVYDKVDESAYQTGQFIAPSLGRPLSYSAAKTLLSSRPERFAWERDHGRPPKKAFDLGSLVHALVLRSRDDRIRVIDAYDWRTKVAQEAQKAAWAARLIPVHRGQFRDAARVARAVREHPLAGALFREGRPEVSLVWTDESGVTGKGRIDWVHPKALVDLKTVGGYGDSEPAKMGKTAANFDYIMQAAIYSDAWHLLTGERLPFLTVAVELDPPHFITVGQYDESDLAVGWERWRQAVGIYVERESAGQWSDPPEIVTLPVPGWYGRTF